MLFTVGSQGPFSLKPPQNPDKNPILPLYVQHRWYKVIQPFWWNERLWTTQLNFLFSTDNKYKKQEQKLKLIL